MDNRYNYYNSIWSIKHIRDGKVIWEDVGRNSLTQQGEESILESFFRGATSYTPTNFYIRLCNYSPLITDTLLTLSGEPTGNGYTPQLVERSSVGFPTKDINDDGNYRLTSKVLTFTASGGSIGPITNAFLATTSDNSGKLISFRALKMQRTVVDGDAITIEIQINLGNA